MFRRGIPATTGHPPGLEPRPRIPLPAVGLILAFAVLLGMLLYYAQFSGAIRWLLGVLALAALAGIAWGQIRRRTAEPAPLVGPRSPEASRDGELDLFAAAVRRASRGLPYSQVLVASRARSASRPRRSATRSGTRARSGGCSATTPSWTSCISRRATSTIDSPGSNGLAPEAVSTASSATSSRGWRRGGEHRVRPGGRGRSPRRGRDRDRRQTRGP